MLSRLGLALLLAAGLNAGHAEIRVRDDLGHSVVLARPAQRVVALAPHATELLFASGGAGRIVGVVRFSDHPPQARRIARVGDNQQVDIERLLALRPELLVVWRHDAAARQLEQLRALGIPLYYSEPRQLQDLPRSLRDLGALMGTAEQAEAAAGALERRIAALAGSHAVARPVRVFYQVWGSPLYTLNARHIVNDALRLCGGENIFAGLPAAAPLLDAEAVLQADPEAIVSGDGRDGSGAAIWKAYPGMLAVRRGNLFSINADLVNRSGPRLVDGAEQLCAYLDLARKRRGEN